MPQVVNDLGWLNYIGDLLPRLLPIDTWESFCIHWGRLSSEAAAIGLLHAGPSVLRHALHGRDENKAREIVAQAVNFYLRYTEEGERHPDVARVAKQVLIGKVIRAQFVSVGDPGLFRTHLALLNFLQSPDPDLHRTPNPKAVLNYLIGLSWQWGGKQNFNPEMHELLQPYGKLIVRTMLGWGWADYLESDYERELVVTTIREFLLGRLDGNWELPRSHELMMRWMDYKPDPDKWALDPNGNTEAIVNARAYCKLIELSAINLLKQPLVS